MPHLSSVSNRIRRRPVSSFRGGQEIGGSGSSPPSGPAGGDLTGEYPNPTFAVNMATQAELDAEAVLARNADNLASGTVADARIASTIARDSEVSSAISAAITASEAGQVRDGDAAGGALAGTYPNPTLAGPALAGTKIYYVSDTNGGTVDRKLTFTNGILTSET